MFTALIIDRDMSSSENITNMLRCVGANLIHATVCTKQINNYLSEYSVDIVLFNIESDSVEAKQVAERFCLQHPNVGIVFLTECTNFAFHAFELSAIDYLLKPVSEERFRRCIQKVWLHLQGKIRENNSLSPHLLSLKMDNGIQLLNQKEIAYINAEGRSSKLIVGSTSKKQFIVSESLRSIEQRIDPNMFIRTHRSYIINLNHIRRIEASGQTNLVFFRNCSDIAYLSKNYALSLYEKLNLK